MWCLFGSFYAIDGTSAGNYTAIGITSCSRSRKPNSSAGFSRCMLHSLLLCFSKLCSILTLFVALMHKINRLINALTIDIMHGAFLTPHRLFLVCRGRQRNASDCARTLTPLIRPWVWLLQRLWRFTINSPLTSGMLAVLARPPLPSHRPPFHQQAEKPTPSSSTSLSIRRRPPVPRIRFHSRPIMWSRRSALRRPHLGDLPPVVLSLLGRSFIPLEKSAQSYFAYSHFIIVWCSKLILRFIQFL